MRHASSQLAVAVQAGPRREVQLAVAVRGEQRIRTQLTQLTIPVVQGLDCSTWRFTSVYFGVSLAHLWYSTSTEKALSTRDTYVESQSAFLTPSFNIASHHLLAIH